MDPMTEKRLKIDGRSKCERCGHEWQNTGTERPIRRPGLNCKSPYWRRAARVKAADARPGVAKGGRRKAT